MGVSKNRGSPKWMVYKEKPVFKLMIWGYPYFWKHPYIYILTIVSCMYIYIHTNTYLYGQVLDSNLGLSVDVSLTHKTVIESR